MNAIKQAIDLLFGKYAKDFKSIEIIASTEMDRLFGGKPVEAISSQAYWWIEDQEPIKGTTADFQQNSDN